LFGVNLILYTWALDAEQELGCIDITV